MPGEQLSGHFYLGQSMYSALTFGIVTEAPRGISIKSSELSIDRNPVIFQNAGIAPITVYRHIDHIIVSTGCCNTVCREQFPFCLAAFCTGFCHRAICFFPFMLTCGCCNQYEKQDCRSHKDSHRDEKSFLPFPSILSPYLLYQ